MSEQQPVEWVGGRVPFSASIAAAASSESALTLWVELPALHVVGQLLEDPSEPATTFAQSLMRAMSAPLIGPARRPRRVRVADELLAEQLRGLSMVEVVVGPTPELDRVVRSLDAILGEGSYFSDPQLSEAELQDFFAASRALYQAQPWEFTVEDAMLLVDIPELEVEGGCLAVMGREGGPRGFVLYPDIDHYHRMLDAVGEGEGAVLETHSAFYLAFEHVAEVSPTLRAEAAAAGWPLPALETYPVLSRALDGRPAPVLHTEVRLATLLARALADFATKHRAALEDYGEQPVRASYVDARGAEASLTVPHPDVDLSDLEAAARAETRSGVANPYELPLSQKELARLEHALSKFTLHRLMGLLTALASVPELVTPTRWLPLISDELKVSGPTEYRAVIDLIMKVYNDVVERVQAYLTDGLIPIEEAARECRDWARGYALVADASKLASLTGVARESLHDILALTEKGSYLETALKEQGRDDKDEYAAELREDLVENTYCLYNAWREARLADAESQVVKAEPVRVGPKTGRNDPCSCGSGKKFKKCCG